MLFDPKPETQGRNSGDKTYIYIKNNLWPFPVSCKLWDLTCDQDPVWIDHELCVTSRLKPCLELSLCLLRANWLIEPEVRGHHHAAATEDSH